MRIGRVDRPHVKLRVSEAHRHIRLNANHARVVAGLARACERMRGTEHAHMEVLDDRVGLLGGGVVFFLNLFFSGVVGWCWKPTGNSPFHAHTSTMPIEAASISTH